MIFILVLSQDLVKIQILQQVCYRMITFMEVLPSLSPTLNHQGWISFHKDVIENVISDHRALQKYKSCNAAVVSAKELVLWKQRSCSFSNL